MRLTSFHALSPRGQASWRLVRAFVPRGPRFLFEGSMEVRGQLWYAERRLLSRTVHRYKPKICIEIGTWEGGGSTLFIAQALSELGVGVLHTVELDAERHAKAREAYAAHLDRLSSFVVFHQGPSLDVVPEVMATERRCDLFFLDGAQDAQQTGRELDLILSYLSPGSIVVAHDWDNDKMAEVRPRITTDPRFEVVERLTAPVSVGMVVVEFKGP